MLGDYAMGMTELRPNVSGDLRQAVYATMRFFGAKLRGALLATATVFLLNGTAWPDDFDDIARSIAQSCKREGFRQIAVLPFIASQEGIQDDGWRLSEELVGRLVRSGVRNIAERSLLEKLLEEQRLQGLGATSPAGHEVMGRMLAADGIVTGTILWFNGKAVANVRMINVATGEIVCAGALRLGRWADRGHALTTGDYRDAIVSESSTDHSLCKNIRSYADELERRTLHVQARFWALRLRRGKHMVGAKPFPGAAISDPDLRQDLYDLIHNWYAAAEIPEPTQTEVERMAMTGRTTAWLHDLCTQKY